jgi:hypothetical protein
MPHGFGPLLTQIDLFGRLERVLMCRFCLKNEQTGPGKREKM